MHKKVNRSFTIEQLFLLYVVFVNIRFIRFIYGVVVITTAQLHPTKLELRGLEIAHGVWRLGMVIIYDNIS